MKDIKRTYDIQGKADPNAFITIADHTNGDTNRDLAAFGVIFKGAADEAEIS